MRVSVSVLAVAAGVSALFPWTLSAQSCRFRAERSSSAETAAVDRVVIAAGAGTLKVVGSSGARRAEASGVACASSQRLLDDTKITVRVEGRVLYIVTEIPEGLSNYLFGNQYAYLDLQIALPAHLPVQAQDSSGDAELRNLRQLKIADSSGDLVIAGIEGPTDVQDSSGDIRINQVASVRLEDSSGDVRVRQVTENVEVLSDSSGDIDIEDVGGEVIVHQDSSGEILVNDVHGNVRVGADSSGSITARQIGGDFTVDSDGSGGIDYENVQGRVVLP